MDAAKVDTRPMQSDDIVGVRRLLRESFFVDEPLCAFLRSKNPNEFSTPFVDDVIAASARDLISVVSVRRDSGDIIGCRLSSIETPTYFWRSFASAERSPHQKIIGRFLHKLENKVDVFTKYNVDKCTQLEMLTVHPRYRGMGVAKKMAEESLKLARAKGIRVAKTVVTNRITIQMYDELKFDRLNEIRYDEYRDDNGAVVFDDMGDNYVAVLFAKYLE